jgi:hypothetical protein
MKSSKKWSIVLAALLLVCAYIGALGDSETNIGVTVDPPASGGGVMIESTDISNLDLVVSPDNPTATAIVTLLVSVDQAVASINVWAEISNKNQLKIKWYNLLENGHLLIGGSAGGPGDKGNSWQFGTVWSSGVPVGVGEHPVEIPVVLDLSAGGAVDPRNIPAGSTNGKATIIWTVTVGTV